MCYRFTKQQNYLDAAHKIARFIIDHRPAENDYIPYWDYDAPKIPNEPRDASAAAITASALLELSGYGDKKQCCSYIFNSPLNSDLCYYPLYHTNLEKSTLVNRKQNASES